MAIRTILQGDVPELRTVSTEVKDFDDNLVNLLNDLRDTIKTNRGLGLSGPQINIHQRVFVVDLGNGVQEFVNPEIVHTSGQVDGYESCLSFPDQTLKITRPKEVTVRAADRFGNPIDITAKELFAQIICHEIDHLNGVLFMDHLSEAELFSQVLANSFLLEDDDENESALVSEIPLAELKGYREELQLTVDMMSELTWKLALCLEMLKDYEFGEAVKWTQLEELKSVVDETIDVVEAEINDYDAVIEKKGDTT